MCRMLGFREPSELLPPVWHICLQGMSGAAKESKSNHEIVSFEELRQGHAGEVLPSNNSPPVGTTKKALLESLVSLREAKHTLLGAVRNIQTTKQSIRDQETSVLRVIHSSFDQLQQVLEHRKQELLCDTERQVKEKLLKLSSQESELLRACVEVQSFVESCETLISDCSNNDIMNFNTEVIHRIQQETERHGSSDDSVKPVEESDIGVEVNCAEELKQLCRAKANVTRLTVALSECSLRGLGMEDAEVLQTAEVVLSTKPTGKEPMKRTLVVGELKSLWDESVVKCSVTQLTAGEYRIQYKPLVRGCHQLSVMVDGQQVAGSPSSVLVSISPTQLGKPVWVGERGAFESIASTSQGEVVIAERAGSIHKIDKNGKVQVLLESSKVALRSLRSLAVDEEDNIYCTDEETNKLLCCNSKGGDVKVFTIHQFKGPGHRGVAVVRDEVFLCERNSTGSIVVYNKELKCLRVISHEDVGELINMSSDSFGNLYATDFSKSMIRVFSSNGLLLHSFGCDGSGQERLERPYDVCVSSDYVYVTNYFGHSVSVFTRDGKYIACFGKGEMKFPRGVCVDRHNFVVVTSYQIQCF